MTWLKLEDCRVAASLGNVEGDLEQVPVLSAPPLPTPTPVPLVCTSSLDKGDCKDAGGKWTETVAGQPYCACPKQRRCPSKAAAACNHLWADLTTRASSQFGA